MSLKPASIDQEEVSYTEIIKNWLEQTRIYDRIHFKGKTEAEWNQKKAML